MPALSASGDRPPYYPALHVLAWRGLVTGLGAGGVVGLLRLSHDHVAARLALLLDGWRVSLRTVSFGIGVPAALAWGLGWIVRANPLVGGSGIPQMELALKGRLAFRWWRVLLAKFAGSWLALFAGLAIGREGSSIQMGGAVGAGFDAVRRPQPEGEKRLFTENPYVMAGAVAGLAAAFGAPMAGVLSAFEEMRSPRRLPLVASSCAAAFGAHVMIWGVFGMGRILPFASFRTPPLSAFWVVAVQGLIFGVPYNRTLLWLHDAEARQTLIPDQWRALPPLMVAGSAAFFLPFLLGGGENLIILVAEKPVARGMLVLLLVLKYLFAQYRTVASIPGGCSCPFCAPARSGVGYGRKWAFRLCSLRAACPSRQCSRGCRSAWRPISRPRFAPPDGDRLSDGNVRRLRLSPRQPFGGIRRRRCGEGPALPADIRFPEGSGPCAGKARRLFLRIRSFR